MYPIIINRKIYSASTLYNRQPIQTVNWVLHQAVYIRLVAGKYMKGEVQNRPEYSKIVILNLVS